MISHTGNNFINRMLRVFHGGKQRVYLTGQHFRGAFGVRIQPGEQIVEPVKFLVQSCQHILGKFQLAAGFHLSGNAADILAPVQRAVIDTAFNVTGLASGNAADVIAHMGVAHGTFIDAGTDYAGIIAGNPSDIRH